MRTAIPLDHVATFDEVCDAISIMTGGLLERCMNGGYFGEGKPGSDAGEGVFREEIAWLPLINEEREPRTH
jgi:hypothetical protein